MALSADLPAGTTTQGALCLSVCCPLAQTTCACPGAVAQNFPNRHLPPAQPWPAPPALPATPYPAAAQTCPHPERKNLTVTNASSSTEEEEEAQMSPVPHRSISEGPQGRVQEDQCQDSSPGFVETTPLCDPCSPDPHSLHTRPGPLPSSRYSSAPNIWLSETLSEVKELYLPPNQQRNSARPKADWSQRAQFQDRPKQALHHRPENKASVCPAENDRHLPSSRRMCQLTALCSCGHGQSQWLLCVTTGNNVSPAELMPP